MHSGTLKTKVKLPDKLTNPNNITRPICLNYYAMFLTLFGITSVKDC